MAPSRLCHQLELDTCSTQITTHVSFITNKQPDSGLLGTKLNILIKTRCARTSYHLSGRCLAPPEAVDRAGYSELPAKMSNQL